MQPAQNDPEITLPPGAVVTEAGEAPPTAPALPEGAIELPPGAVFGSPDMSQQAVTEDHVLQTGSREQILRLARSARDRGVADLSKYRDADATRRHEASFLEKNAPGTPDSSVLDALEQQVVGTAKHIAATVGAVASLSAGSSDLANALAGSQLQVVQNADLLRKFSNNYFNRVVGALKGGAIDKSSVAETVARAASLTSGGLAVPALAIAAAAAPNAVKMPSKMDEDDRARYAKQFEDDIAGADWQEAVAKGEGGVNQIVDRVNQNTTLNLGRVQPAEAESIAGSMLGPVNVAMEFAPGMHLGSAVARGANTAARQLAFKEATSLPKTAVGAALASPLVATAKALEHVATKVDNSPILRAAAAGGLAAAVSDSDPTTAAVAALVGVGYPRFRTSRMSFGANALRETAGKLSGDLPLGPVTQFALKAASKTGPTMAGFTAAQLANTPFLFGNLTEDGFTTNLAAGTVVFGAGNVAGRAATGLNISRRLFGGSEVMPEVRLPTKDYGTDTSLDAAHRKLTLALDNSSSNFVEVLRSLIRKEKGLEVYTVFDADYATALQDLVKSGRITEEQAKASRGQAGVTFETPRGEGEAPQAIALVRVKKSLPGLSTGHEVGHLLDMVISPDEIGAINQEIADTMKSGGIEDFKNVYERMARASGDDNFSLKTTEDVLKEIRAEMYSAVLGSLPISKNGVKPQLSRKVYSAVLRAMEAMGARQIDTVDPRMVQDGILRTGLGLRPSAKIARVIENVIQSRLLDSDVLKGTGLEVKVEPEGAAGKGTSAPKAEKPAEAASAEPAKPAAESWQTDVSGKTPIPAFEVSDRVEIGHSGPVGDEGGIPRSPIVDSTGKVVGYSAKVLQSLGDGSWRIEYTEADAEGKPGARVSANILTKAREKAPVGTEPPVIGAKPVPEAAPAPAEVPSPAPAEPPVISKPARQPGEPAIFRGVDEKRGPDGTATPERIAETRKKVDSIVARPHWDRGVVEFAMLSAENKTVNPDQNVRERERMAADAGKAGRQVSPKKTVIYGISDDGKLLRTWSFDKVVNNIKKFSEWVRETPGSERLVDVNYLHSEEFVQAIENYLQNIANGRKGNGDSYTRPADMDPVHPNVPENPNYVPVKIPQHVVDLVNIVQGLSTPKAWDGRYAYALNMARDNGHEVHIVGEGKPDPNTLRAKLRNEFGFLSERMELKLEPATEAIRIDRIVSDITPRKDLNFRAGDVSVVQAAFMPSPLRIGKDETSNTGLPLGRAVFRGKKKLGHVQENVNGGFEALSLSGQRVGIAETSTEAANLLKDAKAAPKQVETAVLAEKPVSSILTPTGWVLPDGTYAGISAENNPNFQNKGDFHSNWLQNNGQPWGLESGDRAAALNKGFVRMRLDGQRGDLSVEANARLFKGAARDKVEDVLLENLNRTSNIRLNLFDDRGRVVRSDSLRVFDMDEAAQAPAVVDFLRGRRTREVFMPDAAPSEETTRLKLRPAIRTESGNIYSSDSIHYDAILDAANAGEFQKYGVRDGADFENKFSQDGMSWPGYGLVLRSLQDEGYVNKQGHFYNREEAAALLGKKGELESVDMPANARFMPEPSPEQEAALKGSKVRDGRGKLLPLMHATDKSFDKFGVGDLGYHFGTAEQAESRLTGTGRLHQWADGVSAREGTRTIPVFLDIKNPLRSLDVGSWDDPVQVWWGVQDSLPRDAFRRVSRELEKPLVEYSSKVDGYSDSPEHFDSFKQELAKPMLKKIQDELKKQGYDGIVYHNQFEHDRSGSSGDDSYIAFDNEQIMPAFSRDASARWMPDPESAVLRQDTTDVLGSGRMSRATLQDFSPENVKDLPNKKDWALLTAENPNAQKLSPEENARRNTVLRNELEERGYDILPAFGKYGNEENPFAIVGIKPDEALEIGRRFGQESVITADGMLYGDGRRAPLTGEVTVHSTPPEDFYTKVGDSYFTLGLGDTVESKPALAGESADIPAGALSSAKAGARDVAVSTVPLRTGAEKLDLGPKPTVLEVGRALAARARRLMRIPADSRTDYAVHAYATTLHDEIKHAASLAQNAIGWYKSKIDEALGTLGKLHPELNAESPVSSLYKAILAITSNGQAVDFNFERAENLYSGYKKTGRLETDGAWGGSRKNQINGSLEVLQAMIDKFGLPKTVEFLNSKFSVRELKQKAAELGIEGDVAGGESVDYITRGAAIFGPKIGGGFYSNLHGDFSPVTIDLWLMRTWNRINGSYGVPDKPGAARAIEKIRRMAEENPNHPDSALVQSMSDRKLVNWADKRYTSWVRQQFKNPDVFSRPTKNLTEALEGVRESPRGPSERQMIRDVFADVDRMRAEENLPPINNADKQALLWYFEKDLYASQGVRTKTQEPTDYAIAAKKVVEKRLAAEPLQ